MIFLFYRHLRDFLRIAVMGNLYTKIVQAEEILIGYFVECQSIKKVGGRRSVEELYQALFFVSPVAPDYVSPSETKIEPDRRLSDTPPESV